MKAAEKALIIHLWKTSSECIEQLLLPQQAPVQCKPASTLKMAPKLDFSVKTMLLFFVLFISPLLFNYHSVIAEEQNDDNEEFLSSDCSNGASFKGQKILKGKIVVSSILLKKTMKKTLISNLTLISIKKFYLKLIKWSFWSKFFVEKMTGLAAYLWMSFFLKKNT